MKIVVFDLDETLGYFVEFGVLWDCLSRYIKEYENSDYKLTQNDFNNILDLYPEFLRPNIMNILNYLLSKKKSKCCHKMMIYTNNQGPREWGENIVSYFETKLKHKLFDQIIAAFKINGKRIELCRSSHNKSHKDFIKCTKIPLNAEICFLDDSFYPDMSHKNVYYINIKPYIHDLKFEDMLARFEKSEVFDKLVKSEKTDFINIMVKYFKEYKFDCRDKSNEESEVDKILSKQIIVHLQEFFTKPNNKNISSTMKNKTRKSHVNKRNKTSKNI